MPRQSRRLANQLDAVSDRRAACMPAAGVPVVAIAEAIGHAARATTPGPGPAPMGVCRRPCQAPLPARCHRTFGPRRLGRP